MSVLRLSLLCMFAFTPFFAFAEEIVNEVAAEPEAWNIDFIITLLPTILSLPFISNYAVPILAFMGFLGLLAAVLPVGTKGGTWWNLRKLFIDLGANNWGNAKNAKNSK